MSECLTLETDSIFSAVDDILGGRALISVRIAHCLQFQLLLLPKAHSFVGQHLRQNATSSRDSAAEQETENRLFQLQIKKEKMRCSWPQCFFPN